MSDFGSLSHIVKKCALTPRHARIAIHGGGGSGKTYSALQLARGLLGPGGRIVLISLGENRAEELYAGVTDFWHVDCNHPDVTAAAKARFPAARGGLPWEGEGCDPRAVLYVLQQVAPGAGLGGVVIIDSMSEAWDGVKGRVDTFTGGQESKNRFAWAAVAPIETALWEAVETAPCHTIITVRAKTAVHIEERGKTKVPVHVPTDPELRNRNEFRMDVRIFIDSEHRARFAGRLTAVNGSEVALLTPEIGARLKVLLGGDPAATEKGKAFAAGAHPRIEQLLVQDLSLETLCWYLAARDKPIEAPTLEAANAWAAGIDDRAWAKHGPAIREALTRRLGLIEAAGGPLALLGAARVGMWTKAHGAAERLGLAKTEAEWPARALVGIVLAVAEKTEPKVEKVLPGEKALRKALEVPGGEEAVKRALRQVGAPWPTEDQEKGELAYIIEKHCQASAGPEDTVALLCEALAGTGEI